MRATSVASAVKVIYGAASRKRRRQFVATIVVMLIGAVAELMTIGAVLPFLAVISDPARAIRSPLLSGILGLFGSWGQDNVVLAMALLLVAAAVFAGAVRLLLAWMTLRFVLFFGHDLGVRIYGRMLRQPYQHYVMRNTSEYLAGIDKLQSVVYSLLLPVMQGITSSVIAIVIIAMLFYIEPFAAIVAAASMLSTYALVSIVTRGRLRRNSVLWAESAGARVRTVQEGLGGMRDILIDQSQPVFEASFRQWDLCYRRAQAASNFIATAPRYVVETAGIVLIALLAVYMAVRPGGLVGAIPILGALAVGAQRLLPLLQNAYNGWSSFQSNHQVLLDVAHLLETPVAAIRRRDRSIPAVPFRTDIVFDSVGFSYTGRSHALRDASFRIGKSERIGIIGKTGSGKSTLMDLLMGLLEPTSGSIRIDGVPLTSETVADWQAQIAHVPQAIYLSDSSIEANIAFGEDVARIDSDRVRSAAAQAELDEFIQSLPEGYDTVVGERGVRLSGGQRQRIGIARALYKGANVLIFDEATSALDSETETAVMESIARIGGDVTLILIAHRLTTLATCDKILRLEGGRIVQICSYAELRSALQEAGSATAPGEPS